MSKYNLAAIHGDDEKPPILGIWLQNTLMGAGLGLVVYLCAQLVATVAFPDVAMLDHRVFVASFSAAGALRARASHR